MPPRGEAPPDDDIGDGTPRLDPTLDDAVLAIADRLDPPEDSAQREVALANNEDRIDGALGRRGHYKDNCDVA